MIWGVAAGLAACGGRGPAAGARTGLPLPTVTGITPEMEAESATAWSNRSTRCGSRGGPRPWLDARSRRRGHHSRDMAVQNRPGTSARTARRPNDRLARVGYRGALVGEVISETYETELQTLGAWMEDPQTRTVILNRAATRLGLAWFQEESGKIWWTMVLAA
jgi:hypothetical protein